MSNRMEIVEIINTSAETLPDEYRTKKILTVLGDGDDFDVVMQQKASEEIDRYKNVDTDTDTTDDEIGGVMATLPQPPKQ